MSSEFQSREEYHIKLEQWLSEARLWYAVPYQIPQLQNQTPNQAVINQNEQHRNTVTNATTANLRTFYEYVIPPMWKRVVAEVIDFIILLVIKMSLTFLILESFDVIDLDNYGFNMFQKNLQNPKIAMQISVEILMLEILHRFVVCCYEIYWLRGGATPGKMYMGLSVVHVTNIVSVPGHLRETVHIYPATKLGLRDAVIRALLKNVFVGLMLPICFVLLFFKHNRTGYDILTNSLVVEYHGNPVRHQVR